MYFLSAVYVSCVACPFLLLFKASYAINEEPSYMRFFDLKGPLVARANLKEIFFCNL